MRINLYHLTKLNKVSNKNFVLSSKPKKNSVSIIKNKALFSKNSSRILVATPLVSVNNKYQHHYRAPTFIEPLRSVDAHIDSTVVFECILYGEPTPYVTWEHNGIELCEGDSLSDSTSKHHLYRLTLRHVQTSDCGEYACKAKNHSGEATSVADLRIYYPNQQQNGK